MVKGERETPIDLVHYCPQELEQTVIIGDAEVPDRDFYKGEIARWKTMMTPAMVVVSNLVHRDYPDSYCQIQMSPSPDGNIHVFFVHAGKEVESDIPEGLVEEIFLFEMGPQIMSELSLAEPSNNN